MKKIFLHNIKTEIKMDDILLLDAIERYKNGEILPPEKLSGRAEKNNPDI